MATTDTDRQDEGRDNYEADGPSEDWTPESEPIADGDDAELAGFEAENRPGQLDLGDEEASLPWLEGDDDDFEEESTGGSFLLLALMALGALALIIGGIWWFTRERGESELVADGSLIEAPDQPYKEKPADPGGKTFEGTGDTSYAVSEGEMRPVQLGEGAQAPKPGFEAVGPSPASTTKPPVAPTKAGSPAVPAPAATPAVVASGPGVQVGAYSSRAAAEAGWSRLVGVHSALSGVKYRVVEGKADIGTVYRLQALPGDAAAAKSLCAKLKAAGQDCAVKN